MAGTQMTGGMIFINVSNDPEESRAALRTYVRRTVMSDYHRRRRRQRSKQTVASPDQGRGLAPAGSDTRLSHGLGAARDESDEPRAGSDELGPRRPSISLQLWSNRLFRNRTWRKAMHNQMAGAVRSFLCGQTTKAAQRLSCTFFVHRRFDQEDEGDRGAAHSLNACQKLLHTIEFGPKASHDTTNDYAMRLCTFWELVQKQQDVLYLQCQSLSRWGLLSAAQAITLYILAWVRTGGDQQTFPNANIALLFTLGKLFRTLKARHLHADSTSTALRPVDGWDDWIFRESCLRVACVYFVLTIVVLTDFGFSCNEATDWCIKDLPLPASKMLWEADTKRAWEENFEKSSMLGVHPTFGDLVGSRRARTPACQSWHEGADELGLIITMAGQLLQELPV